MPFRRVSTLRRSSLEACGGVWSGAALDGFPVVSSGWYAVRNLCTVVARLADVGHQRLRRTSTSNAAVVLPEVRGCLSHRWRLCDVFHPETEHLAVVLPSFGDCVTHHSNRGAGQRLPMSRPGSASRHGTCFPAHAQERTRTHLTTAIQLHSRPVRPTLRRCGTASWRCGPSAKMTAGSSVDTPSMQTRNPGRITPATSHAESGAGS